MNIVNTKNIEVGDVLVLLQEDRKYYYEVLEILSFNNVKLKLIDKGIVYKEVRLNEDGYFIKGE